MQRWLDWIGPSSRPTLTSTSFLSHLALSPTHFRLIFSFCLLHPRPSPTRFTDPSAPSSLDRLFPPVQQQLPTSYVWWARAKPSLTTSVMFQKCFSKGTINWMLLIIIRCDNWLVFILIVCVCLCRHCKVFVTSAQGSCAFYPCPFVCQKDYTKTKERTSTEQGWREGCDPEKTHSCLLTFFNIARQGIFPYINFLREWCTDQNIW